MNQMNKGLSWKEMKSLHDLYEKRKSSASILSHPYIKHLQHDKGLITHKIASTKVIIPCLGFDEFYESEFKNNFIHYRDFLIKNEIYVDARSNLQEEDIKTLMMIYENKKELSDKLTNIEDFSSKLFTYGGGAKYLKNRNSVRNAVLKILQINEFPQEKKDHNWRLVVDCKYPKAVVLCENQSFLKHTWIPKELQVKLWYVGGNNIAILNEIDNQDLKKPIFYSCDWDLAGLQIYSRVRNILNDRGAIVTLLYPTAIDKCMPTDSYLHNSHWNTKDLSGLDTAIFSNKEKSLIEHLIRTNQWIEEESNDFKRMVNEVLEF